MTFSLASLLDQLPPYAGKSLAIAGVFVGLMLLRMLRRARDPESTRVALKLD